MSDARWLTGADYGRAWDRIGAEAPEYVAYRPRTAREIPVIRLARRREA